MDRNNSHVGTAQGRLIEVLKNKPNVRGLINALIGPLEELEGVFWDIRDLTDIDDATGEQLDVLGRIVNQERAGFDDDTYRLFLKARVQLNRSSGTVPEVVEVFQLILPAGGEPHVYQAFPKSFTLQVQGAALTEEQVQLYRTFLAAAADAGARFFFEWSPTTDADTFTFDGPVGAGFGDTTDPDTGGQLSGVIE